MTEHPLDRTNRLVLCLHINTLEQSNQKLQQELDKAQKRIAELEAEKAKD